MMHGCEGSCKDKDKDKDKDTLYFTSVVTQFIELSTLHLV